MDNALGITLVLSLGVLLVIFLITREFWAWYWKINEILRTLKSIDAKLDRVDLYTGEISGAQKSRDAGLSRQELYTRETPRVSVEGIPESDRPNSPQRIFDRYSGMEDSTLAVRYRDREQYADVERAVIEWEYDRRNLSGT